MNYEATKKPAACTQASDAAATSRGYPPPRHRKLRVFSIDPSLSKSLEASLINEVTIDVPWTDVIGERRGKGPVGEYLEVVDFDPASKCFYAPVDLNDPSILASDGLPLSEGNPQFHQLMVYAVVMATIGHFERALGRAVLWSQREERNSQGDLKSKPSFVRRLRIYPHAFRGANAYYSPEKKALLFGYFTAGADSPDQIVPGSQVFTCLSHDIIVHETTHAILDGMHPRFAESTNPDVLALHEAFSDIVALFQHFSFPEVLRHQIALTRGDLDSSKLLGELAQQFGVAIGRRGALRSAIGSRPDPLAIQRTTQVHTRGSILVAAVFDAFLAIYEARTIDLLRLATQGSGLLPAGHISNDLVNRLADEAAKSARHILHMCIRAMDYVPPVDVTFGDFLRALITADFDLHEEDPLSYRVALLESFRRRGIYPRDLRNFAVDSLLWSAPASVELDPTAKSMNLEFTLQASTQEEQEEAEARHQSAEQVAGLGPVIKDARSLFEKLQPVIGRLSDAAKTTAEDRSLASELVQVGIETIDAKPVEPAESQPGVFRLSLEWNLNTDRETAWESMNGNGANYHNTWIKLWATSYQEWALRELGLVLYDTSVPGAADQNEYTPIPQSVYFSSGAGSLPAGVPATQVHAFRIARRQLPRGDFLTELVLEITQRRRGYFSEAQQVKVDLDRNQIEPGRERGDFTFRGGCTLIIDPRKMSDETFGIRRVITKGSILDERRLADYRRFLTDDDGSLRATYFGMPSAQARDEQFAILH